jgi:hypothetical protein
MSSHNYDESQRVPLSGNPPVSGNDAPAPDMATNACGMHKDYWVLSDEERAKGFVRPVRLSYVHLKCGTSTRMNQKIAETYARDPKFYGATYCVKCCDHFPVGESGEFLWPDGSKVGT